MIESIERLRPKLQSLGSCQRHGLFECQVEIIDTWTVEEAAACRAHRAFSRQTEQHCVERRLSVAWIGIYIYWAGGVVWRVHSIVMSRGLGAP